MNILEIQDRLLKAGYTWSEVIYRNGWCGVDIGKPLVNLTDKNFHVYENTREQAWTNIYKEVFLPEEKKIWRYVLTYHFNSKDIVSGTTLICYMKESMTRSEALKELNRYNEGRMPDYSYGLLED